MSRSVRDIRSGWEPELLVGRLPDSRFVDVDTPHACEAARRAGLRAGSGRRSSAT